MSQNPYSQGPPAYSPPPVQQAPAGYPAPAQRRSVWPKVVGSISIAVGALFLLMAVVGAINPGARLAGPQARQFEENLPEWVGSWKWASGALSVCTYGALVLAGICLIKLRRVTRPLHLLYCLLGFVQGVFGLVFTLKLMEYIPMPPNAPPAARQIVRVSMIFGSFLGLLFAWAYPVFLLIWFFRRKIVAEMRGWGGTGT